MSAIGFENEDCGPQQYSVANIRQSAGYVY